MFAVKGGGSGGTIESGITAFKEVLADPEVAKIMEHPYSLTPQYKDEAALKELRNKGSPMRPMWSKPLQCWTGPFIMAEHNEKIVNMSTALLGWKYGVLFVAPDLDSVHCRPRMKAKNEGSMATQDAVGMLRGVLKSSSLVLSSARTNSFTSSSFFSELKHEFPYPTQLS